MDPTSDASWEYIVDAPPEKSRVVTVEATFIGARTARLGIADESAVHVHDLEVKTDRGFRPVNRWGPGWLEPMCARKCTVRYHIDLDQLAATCGDEVDCAMRVGAATLSPALAWLVHPTPKLDVPATVRVRAHDASQFMTGMHPADVGTRTYSFRAPDLDEGSFTAFGPMRRFNVEVPGRFASEPSRIEVGVLGPPMSMDDGAIKGWVSDSGRAVSALFGQFPVRDTTLFVVPAPDASEVIFGKVLSLAGASVVVVVGNEMPASSSHSDWVLVHELFHLGFPSFRGEGRWLGEGLATYYEPILRARAGWVTEPELWTEFARQMPRGQPKRGSKAGLARREDLDSIYWGGAMFALAADVKIREETHNLRSLDDVVRTALARGGDATRVWTVAEVLQLGDQVTGTRVLSDMFARYVDGGDRIDLDGVLASMGVLPRPGGVALADDRALSHIRKSIVASR